MREALRRTDGAEDEQPAGQAGEEMLADQVGPAGARRRIVAALDAVGIVGRHPRNRRRPGPPAVWGGERGIDRVTRRGDDELVGEREGGVRLMAVGDCHLLRGRGGGGGQEQGGEGESQHGEIVD